MTRPRWIHSSTLVLGLTAALAAPTASTDYQSARRKFASIEDGRVKPGARIRLSAGELNAYVQTELGKVAPPGVSEPSVELIGGNRALGRLMVNFSQLRSASGQKPNWLVRQMFSGVRPLALTARIQSGDSRATVFVERVELSGIPLEGPALDFLIDHYFRPRYPEAKVSEPFALKYGMDRIEVTPGVAHVIMLP